MYSGDGFDGIISVAIIHLMEILNAGEDIKGFLVPLQNIWDTKSRYSNRAVTLVNHYSEQCVAKLLSTQLVSDKCAYLLGD